MGNYCIHCAMLSKGHSADLLPTHKIKNISLNDSKIRQFKVTSVKLLSVLYQRDTSKLCKFEILIVRVPIF